MNKFLIITIPVLTLSIFILVMLSGNYLKKSMSTNDNIPQTIEGIIEDISQDNWEQVKNKAEYLEIAWKNVVNRIQYSSERDEINSFSINLARLNGAIIARDKAIALVEMNEAYAHWEELGK